MQDDVLEQAERVREALAALPKKAKGKAAKERASLVAELERLMSKLSDLGDEQSSDNESLS
eukprot:SAG31_NODE_5447_length_2532_cov_17.404439_2_plen_61_part_00